MAKVFMPQSVLCAQHPSLLPLPPHSKFDEQTQGNDKRRNTKVSPLIKQLGTHHHSHEDAF
jgi:hypothetical protein